MTLMLLLAQRNEEINNWLSQNPLILGLIFVGLGLAVGGWGVYELFTGVSYSKRGKEVSGSTGKILTIVRLVVGVGCILFGLYKMVLG